MEHAPVLARRGIPFTLSWTNVDINRTEIVVLLVAYNAQSMQYIVGKFYTDGVPVVREPGTFKYSCTEFIPSTVYPMWLRMLASGQLTCSEMHAPQW